MSEEIKKQEQIFFDNLAKIIEEKLPIIKRSLTKGKIAKAPLRDLIKTLETFHRIKSLESGRATERITVEEVSNKIEKIVEIVLKHCDTGTRKKIILELKNEGLA